VCVYVCVHVDFPVFFSLPEMVNKVEYNKISFNFCLQLADGRWTFRSLRIRVRWRAPALVAPTTSTTASPASLRLRII